MQRFWLQAAIILGAGLIVGLAFSLASPVQLRLGDVNAEFRDRPARPVQQPVKPVEGGSSAAPQSTQASTPTPPAASPASDLFITVEAAKAVHDGGAAVFIDARPLDEYLKGHIPGAMHLEKDALNGPPPAKVLNYLPGMEVVVYCHGELCTDSENVIKRLAALKKDIGPFRIIQAGFPGWVKAGLPTATGPEVGFE
ncbi:MAG: hypothetical protein KF678_06950 [Phycisphaeraceae bacterium]|nr:hypothetical protein [Phycisphaeraceae bacterium]